MGSEFGGVLDWNAAGHMSSEFEDVQLVSVKSQVTETVEALAGSKLAGTQVLIRSS